MPRIQLLVALLLSTALALPCPAANAAEGDSTSDNGEWIELFNGRDLTGWTPKIKGYEAGDNYANTFRVQDGKLVVTYDGYDGPFNDRFGHLFYQEPFSNYVLRLEYRHIGEQLDGAPAWARANSGIMIHGQTPESMGREQDFPVAIEVQLLSGRGDETRPTANVCTPGTHIERNGKLQTDHCTNSKSQTYPIGEWVAVEVEVHGDKLIRHRVNGETVLEYGGSQLDEKDADAKKRLAAGASKIVTGGTISLQSESHPVEFRNIKLKRLPE